MIELYVFLSTVFIISLILGTLNDCGLILAILGISSGIGIIVLTSIMLFGLGF